MLMAELTRMVDEGVDGEVESLSLKSISERTGVSFYFLQKVAVDLRKAGLIRAVRGCDGGYILGVNGGPEVISLKMILEAIDGPVAVVDCIAAKKGVGCERAKKCKVRAGMNRLNGIVSRALEGVSLEEFVHA